MIHKINKILFTIVIYLSVICAMMAILSGEYIVSAISCVAGVLWLQIEKLYQSKFK